MSRAPSGVHTSRTHAADCHFLAYKAYIAHCGEWSTQALKHSADLSEMCAHAGRCRVDCRRHSGDVHQSVEGSNEGSMDARRPCHAP